jgi:hypothetical protein
MLFASNDDTGITMYMVCNDQGLCLIRTSDGAVARFVEEHSHGIDPSLRLTVGGDPGTRKKNSNNPIFHHIRRYRR